MIPTVGCSSTLEFVNNLYKICMENRGVLYLILKFEYITAPRYLLLKIQLSEGMDLIVQ